MVGRWHFPLGRPIFIYFQGRTISFREGNHFYTQHGPFEDLFSCWTFRVFQQLVRVKVDGAIRHVIRWHKLIAVNPNAWAKSSMLVHQTVHAVNGLVKVTGRFRKVWCPTNLLGQSGLKKRPWSDGSMKFGLKSSKYLQLQLLIRRWYWRTWPLCKGKSQPWASLRQPQVSHCYPWQTSGTWGDEEIYTFRSHAVL